MEHHYKRKRDHFKSAIYIAAFVNLILGIAKIYMGSRDHSHSLVIDGIHSFSDLLSDVALFWISFYAHQAPDENHPYGHEKFETLGTVGLGSLLLITAGALVYETIEKLFFSQDLKLTPEVSTIYVAIGSILLNEFLFRYTIHKSKKINSQLLAANAWHHRTDAISSVIVLIGVLFSRFAYPWIDDIAALIIAIMIARIGWKYLNQAIKELADRSLLPDKVKALEKTITNIQEVKSVHNLRTRKMGEKTLVDVNIEVDPNISVTEGHEIASWTAKVLMDNYDDVSDVTVHTDTENDMAKDFVHDYQQVLPLRNEVLKELNKLTEGLISFDQLQDIRLNYYGSKIEIEFILAQEQEIVIEQSEKLKEKFMSLSWFGGLKFLIIKEA